MTALRLSRRLGVAMSTTLGLWACMDVETLLSSKDPHAIQHKWVGLWARRVLASLGVDVLGQGLYLGDGERYPGRSPDGKGRLFILNHRSAIDIFLTFALTEGHLVSRHDLADWPIVGRGAKRLGTLFVDRSSMVSGASVLKLMTRSLEEGLAIAIYPEGTAFSGDEVRPFRPGAFRAAQKTGAEIIPLGVAYDDPAAYYGDESFAVHTQRVAGLPALRASVAVGEPIVPDGLELRVLRDRARESVQELVHRARARL
jgi:1-acyl-sn-glycerol-3-phosphate acyltransferase